MVTRMSNRLKRLEQRADPPKRLPNAIEIYADENKASAIDRFCKLHEVDQLPANFAVLWLPTWRSKADFAAACKKQQAALLANARTVKSSGNA